MVKIKVKKLLLPLTLRTSLDEASMMMVHCQKSVRSSRSIFCKLCFKLNLWFLKFWLKRYAYFSISRPWFFYCTSQLLFSIRSITYISKLWICSQFRIIVVAEFVKQNSWPELVPDLLSAIQNSNLISNGADWRWNTINALTVLHALLRPFQVLNLWWLIN